MRRRARRAQEVGPELGLHADEEAGPRRFQRAAHRAGQVEREVAVHRGAREPVGHDAGAGRRDRGDHDAELRPAPVDGLDQRHRRRRLPHRHRVDPAARLGGQPVAEPTEALRQVVAVAGAPAAGQEDGQVREQPHAEDGGVERVHQARASSSTCQVTVRSAASTSLRAASSAARSASARHPDGLAEAHHAAGERLRDPELVPGAQPPFPRRARAPPARSARRSGAPARPRRA